MKTFFLLLCAIASGSSALGQLPRGLADGAQVAAGFSQASSIRIDPSGLIYIADPGRHVVEVRRPDGDEVFVLGGPGSGEGQFDEPYDVDPTTGLLIAVADAGNSRIVRFGARYEFTETIPLYGNSREALDLSVAVLNQHGLGGDLTPGRPVAVALSEANETFAIDEMRGVVAKWDISRRLVGLIGDGSGEVRLRRPVDLEIVGDLVYVADAGVGSVVVFDLFGGYVTEYGGRRLVSLQGLGSWNGLLWVLHDQRVSSYSSGGGLESTVALPVIAKNATDVAVFQDKLYVLTPERLLSWPMAVVERVGATAVD